MKIALIADIHGNLAAFDAALAAVAREEPDQIVCLGDVAASGPQPHEVLTRLRELACPVVLGNADAELIDRPADAPVGDEETRKIMEISRWCAAQLDEADRAFIASFQPAVAIALGGAGRLLCFHGSPRSFDDVILAATPDDALEPMLAGDDATILAGGHTHVRMLRSWRGREIVNPGSVGLAYQFLPDGSVRVPAWAELAFVIAGGEGTVRVDFQRVPYDRGTTVRAMVERSMPHASWWAEEWR